MLSCLLLGGCAGISFEYGDAYEALLGETPEPSQLGAVEMAFDRESPDRQRTGLSWMAANEYGGAEEYLAAYRLFVQSPDPGVRAAAANALGHHGKPNDAQLLVGLLIDDDAFVRWQAANALRKIHYPPAAPALVEKLDPDLEDDPDTRAAAAFALGQYPDRVVFSALVSALGQQGSYQVAAAAERSLNLLTGHDGGPDPRKWIEWSGRKPDLFAKAKPYTYDVYDPTLTYLDRVLFFWDSYDPSPQTPVGLDAKE